MAKRPLAKHLRYAVEGAFVGALFALFRLLPLPLASGAGAALAAMLAAAITVETGDRREV